MEVWEHVDVDILNRNLDPGNVIWRYYQTYLTPELTVKSGILKEMLMLRDSNQEQIFRLTTRLG